MARDPSNPRPDLEPYIGKRLTVIAWLWARTVKSPNPAFADVDVPLASTFMLSTKKGKEAYVEPVVEGGGYRFTVKVGKPVDATAAKSGTKLSPGANFKCLMSDSPMTGDYIKAEGKAGCMGARLMAVVALGNRRRVYLSPTPEIETVALSAEPTWAPEGSFVEDARAFTPCIYGLKEWRQLFTGRQLVGLKTFSDLVQEARGRVLRDAIKAGLLDDGQALEDSGSGAAAYADAVVVYLAFAIDRMAMTGNSLVRWNGVGEKAQHCFGRHVLPMLWDFAEPNFLAEATGSVTAAVFYS
jgi:putative DNA methylase